MTLPVIGPETGTGLSSPRVTGTWQRTSFCSPEGERRGSREKSVAVAVSVAPSRGAQTRGCPHVHSVPDVATEPKGGSSRSQTRTEPSSPCGQRSHLPGPNRDPAALPSCPKWGEPVPSLGAKKTSVVAAFSFLLVSLIQVRCAEDTPTNGVYTHAQHREDSGLRGPLLDFRRGTRLTNNRV